jgi:hypothetical protein
MSGARQAPSPLGEPGFGPRRGGCFSRRVDCWGLSIMAKFAAKTGFESQGTQAFLGPKPPEIR